MDQEEKSFDKSNNYKKTNNAVAHPPYAGSWRSNHLEDLLDQERKWAGLKFRPMTISPAAMACAF
jgi:hypothetical protein